ncbi:MAG: hypothetical protein ACTSSG_07355 [Candidatus Heimdallarchaeaceae archaeon]
MVAEKYEFIQILIYLRDKIKCQEYAKIIQDMLTDLLLMDQYKIKEKFVLF